MILTQGMEQIQKYIKQGKKIYIYGTGIWGRNIYQALEQQGIFVHGFVVTIRSEHSLFDLPVYEFAEIAADRQVKDSIFILALNQHNTKEVTAYLVSHHIKQEQIISSGVIMGNEDERCGYDETPCIDITMKIGCSINCKYCPQDVFLREYLKDNKDRACLMTMETLIRCIEHMPSNAVFQFGGFAEPFLNPQCVPMIRKVCEMGKTVDLYTTLVGLNEKMLKEVLELPIGFVTLHIADEKQYANIPLTDEYYKLLEIIIEHKRSDGRPFVGMCNAQARPDKRAEKICGKKYVITSSLFDRAGNLEGEELVSKSIGEGKISCGVCGSGLNKNELLPDGTLLLCCMDYGMKHVLGNLREQSYEEIMRGQEMKRIKEGMLSDFSRDILCRKCSCAKLI
ncbi:radical SAM/SPASM domain-containing protein [Lachnospiraceae bacterium JLR.KK008]